MKNIFRYDGPFVRLMEALADFVITNILTVLCCIPIITVGAAFAGHQKVMQNIVTDNRQPVLRTYFFTMWENFRQATGLWIFFLLAAVFLAADFFFAYLFTSGILTTVLFIALGIMSLLVCGVVACCFGLIVRYENKLKEHFRNALFLSLSHWPRILVMALVLLAPAILAVVDLATFFNTVPFWLFVGISVLVFLQAWLIRPIFEQLEDTAKEPASQDTQQA